MKILIIGCGYVGKVAAKLWKDSGHIITVTTTTPAKVKDLETIADQVIVTKGDDREKLSEIIEDQELILLTVAAPSRNLDAYQTSYLQTAQNLVYILSNQPNSVTQLIYTSSYSLLGNHQGNWVTEEVKPNPSNEYNQILYETEQVLLSLANRLNICILRLGGIQGPDREILKFFQSWAGQTRPGTGEDFSNWIHLDDIINAIELARVKSLTGIYHLANDVPLLRKDLLDRMCEKYNLPKITWDISQPEMRPYNLRLSNQKIKDAGLKLIHPETII